MNYLVTYSIQDIGDQGPEQRKKKTFRNTTELNQLAIDWLKAYHRTEDIDEVYAYADNAQTCASIENLFDELKSYAAKYFNTNQSLELEIRENTISISQSKNRVYMNSVVSIAFLSYVATQIYHSYVLLDTVDGRESEEDIFCYRYTLFILNDMCFNDFKQPIVFPNMESADMLLSKFKDNQHLLNLSCDIFYSSIAFALLHEISHAYLQHNEQEANLQKEYEADANAYRMFLDFCDDIHCGKINSNFAESLQPHTYMAPMYLLEFYYVVYYTGSFLCPYRNPVKKEVFDEIVKRKEALFEVFYSWDRDTNEAEAYDLYNYYLEGEESFLRSFVASDKKGMLDELKRRNYERHHE